MSLRHLIVAARFNELVTKSLVESALSVYQEQGLGDTVDVVWVPGAFEIPVTAAKAARTKRYASIVCLGAVIRGETPHFEYVSGPCASGLMSVGIETGIPTINGVLTTNTVEQALNRAGLKMGNKGGEAALTAISMVKTLKQFD